MKGRIILPILLIVSTFLIAQEVKVDSYGMLTVLPDKNANSLNNNDIKKYSEELKKQEIKRLDDKFKSANKNLSDSNSDLYKFYSFIGVKEDVLKKILNDLKAIEKADLVKNGIILSKLEYYSIFNTIESHTVIEKNAITYEIENSKTSLVIKQKNNFNTCYSEYVKSIFDSNKELFKKLDAGKFLTSITYLQFYKYKMDSLIRETENPKNEYNAVLLNNIISLNKQILLNKKISELKQLVNTDWFIQLSWLNNGYLRLNPFDSKAEEFIVTYSTEAKERAAKFNAYIEHLLDWYIERDTTANVDKFKSILNLRNTGAQLYKPFTLEEFNNKIYSKPYNNINPASIVLNSITKESLKCSNKSRTIFANTKNDELNDYYNAPLIVENKKTIFVQNLKKDQTIKVDTTIKLITDRSNFQNELDAIIEDAAQIGAIALSLSGYTGLLNQITLKPNNSYIYSAPRQTTTTNEKSRVDRSPSSNNLYPLAEKVYTLDELVKEIKFNIIQKEQFYDDAFIQASKDTNLNKFVDTKTINKQPIKYINNNEKFENAFLTAYYRELENQFNSKIDDLIALRTNISMLCDVFSKSSLPHKLFDESDAKPEPLHQTKKIEVKTLDKPALVNVSIKNVGVKETKEIAKFKFRTGKAYRIQLGAGLAYTDWRLIKKDHEFIQTTITENNGTIDIKNTYQPVRFVAGMHIQLGKGLLLQNNGFVFCHGITNLLGRTSIFVGVGVPKPLENIYTGLGLDLWPGLKATAGIHWYRNDFYTITNNKIVAQKPNFNGAPFIGINIDPTSLLKGLGVIKKLN